MKRALPTFVFVLAAATAMTIFGQTAGVRKVYILAMSGGFDQFLAEQLTREHVMQVVADPKTADVVLTDRLGEPFEKTLAKIHPRDEDDDDAAETHPGFRSSTAAGTIFLVDLKSRHVLWSDFEKPGRSSSQGALNRKAARIAKNLREWDTRR
jgi:hypothetical protein